jgi:endonuclease/exonuclease/phosphatase family metal-dependent hydrolase
MQTIARPTRWVVALLACVFCPLAAMAQVQDIRIVTFNTQDDVSSPTPSGALPYLATVLEGVGQQKYVGDNILQLPDIIALQETTSNSTTVTPLVNDLNSYYGSNVFGSSTFQALTSDGVTDGGGPNALIYNQNTLNLLASTGVGTPGGTLNGVFRQVMRYEFQPVADTNTSNGIFYVYDSHYKAGDPTTTDGGIQDQTLRNEEAQIIRNNETSLPSTARVLYVGDYNMRDSSDPAYETMTGTLAPNGGNQGQGFDPMNPTSSYSQNWYENEGFASLLTEADDDLYARFDAQLMTGNVYNDSPGGLDYISGSYHPFGNNGGEEEGSNINSGTNSSVNDTQGNGTQGFANTGTLTVSQILSAESASLGSDHLPVVADYSIAIPEPATLGMLGCAGTILLRRRRLSSGRSLLGRSNFRGPTRGEGCGGRWASRRSRARAISSAAKAIAFSA